MVAAAGMEPLEAGARGEALTRGLKVDSSIRRGTWVERTNVQKPESSWNHEHTSRLGVATNSLSGGGPLRDGLQEPRRDPILIMP